MPAHADRPTVLIVDDTPANLDLLVEVLRKDYRTTVAISGERALRLIGEGPAPDLVLLDVMMPGLNGYEVCRRLKADPATRSIPVIFVTALSDVDDEARGLELGGVDYLTKPFSPPIVKARVKTHLALAAQARTLEQRVADGIAELQRVARLKRYFSPSMVDLLLSGAADDPLRSHRCEVSAVALDLRGFTAFTETSDPEDVMCVLRQYHESMGALIMAHGGTLEHFAGDGMMIYFNDPLPINDPAGVAVRMAIGMQQRFGTLVADWRRRGYDLSMGIGIAYGFATIGTIGFEGRRDYGVIGTVTNLAARLCGESSGGEILVSQRVHGLIADSIRTEFVGDLHLKGFHRPMPTYVVRGLLDSPHP
ncbi:MAG: response regulator [Burkholderiaceae bacterium]